MKIKYTNPPCALIEFFPNPPSHLQDPHHLRSPLSSTRLSSSTSIALSDTHYSIPSHLTSPRPILCHIFPNHNSHFTIAIHPRIHIHTHFPTIFNTRDTRIAWGGELLGSWNFINAEGILEMEHITMQSKIVVQKSIFLDQNSRMVGTI